VIRAKFTLCAVVAAAAVLAASAAPASGAATRAEYIAQADPICAKDLRLQGMALKGYFNDLAKERWRPAARKMSKAIPPYVEMVGDLRALSPPAADAPGITDWENKLASQIPLARRLASALRSENRRRIGKSNNRLIAASTKAMAMVRGFGFKDCDEV